MLFALVVSGVYGTEGNTNSTMDDSRNGKIGVIVDTSSRIGKEEILAMQMAVEDFNSFRNKSFSLVIRDYKNDPNLAALAANDLIYMQRVQVLIGPQTWEATSVVAEVGDEKQIPVLALVNEIPKYANKRFKFLVEASPSQLNQMRAIAGIVSSWDWHLVNVIYEDKDLSTTGIFPHLVHALRDVGAEVSEFVGLSQFDSDLFSKELERLRRGSSRIFVVHMSFKSAMRLFEMAKEMGMMGKDYVWIATDSFTNLAYSLNFSSNTLLQGVVGVKSFFPENNPSFHEFYNRFSQRFRLEHSDEDNHEPGIFAIRAYDAARTVAMAMSEMQEKGNHLMEKIELTDFQGLSGKIQFKDRQLASSDTFQIINVMGRSYRELGFWSNKLGFSRELRENSSSSSSMKDLVEVLWPGGSSTTPRGWVVPTDATPLRIGVPTSSMFKEYVHVEEDPMGNNLSFNGLAIDLFKATLDNLNFSLPYQFFRFDGPYDDLVEQIYQKNFDAAVGDIAILSRRYKHAEFTHPYSEAGLVMVVPTTKDTSNRALMFTKPFTVTMWFAIALMNVYNGFVVWFIERNRYPGHEGSMFNQAGTMLCSSFTTLFSLHGNMLHSNLSRMTMVVWLFMALVITQIYTANLTSMLTIQKLEPTVTDIETLQRANALVGFGRGSFVKRYLEEVLHFRSENIRNYSTPDDYAEALRNKEIAAAFLEVPFVKIFLARFCREFMVSGPTYKVGGFGFAFPRGSPMLTDINKALLKVSETGKFRDLEDSMIANEKCEDEDSKGEKSSLSPSSFFILFVLSGGVSTIALTLYIFNAHNLNFQQNTIWRLMIAIMRHWGNQRRRFSRRVSDESQMTVSNNFSNDTNLQIQVQ
ncbi:glutamate-gated kainate-type ion channel receptor subunit glur5 [Cucumis melo var. makuwa]|uniref:Glutamate receptor n=3 Tax=Cucumis melo TaxID=3656 RepID=A0A5A7VI27_CUCMM|nr:glutamate-gated kainate-type ion channel receptor subunit glur5 [Cucumis melo subsp. melo]KAA0066787.1 glutamate-gated kainate-type ion channel receptor subunit glur5 [Cucumis melo var. makuwa]TYK27934.1 glutamate-gated kainate-type ion channel receptor subunit glur5 [Cucumis melo var. makuwa]